MKLIKHRTRQSTVQQKCRAIAPEGALIHNQCVTESSQNTQVYGHNLVLKCLISYSTLNNSNIIQIVYQELPFLLLIVI